MESAVPVMPFVRMENIHNGPVSIASMKRRQPVLGQIKEKSEQKPDKTPSLLSSSSNVRHYRPGRRMSSRHLGIEQLSSYIRAAILNDFGSLTVENLDDLPHRMTICLLSPDRGGRERSSLASSCLVSNSWGRLGRFWSRWMCFSIVFSSRLGDDCGEVSQRQEVEKF